MPATFHGSCLCGRVGFEVNADPIVVSCCHCKNCKKYTGTVFTTNVVFPAGTVRVTRGESLVGTFHDDVAQDSGNPIPRHFCTHCATPLYCTNCDFGRNLSVFYSALDDFSWDTPERLEAGKETVAEAVPPQVEYYAKDRTAWVRPVEGALQANTKPGRE
ncbi:hypothetical protein M0805_004469 [Coniferiporia weirii]|nr:hypothetical protein M0805_004469 [Coniferiporia weirii]